MPWAYKVLFGLPFLIVIFICKWGKRHASKYEIKKLSEGGFDFVFKAKLHNGPSLTVKMLDKSKGTREDFINEVATIGRIHHGSKISCPLWILDKFIFSKERNIHLRYEKMYNISIGVACGIAYLHHGCEMQILHFDVKSHNILLVKTSSLSFLTLDWQSYIQ